MKIAGIQPLSLLDFPGQPCAIVFTQGCPFRCAFCHNPDLIPHGPGILDADEALHQLKQHQKMVNAVCVTGGEPTVQPDLPAFLHALKANGFQVKLDTNGIHPNMVRQILADGSVDFVAMDLKHVWDGYTTISKVSAVAIEHIRQTFDLLQSGTVAHEFRTTIVPAFHLEEHLEHMASYFAPNTAWAWQPVRYEKTLDPNLARRPDLPLDSLRLRILQSRPDLRIELRV